MKNTQRVQNYTIYTVSEKTRALSCILQTMLLWLGAFSTIYCFSTSLAMTIPFWEILLWSLLFTGLFALILFNKITLLIGASALGAATVIFWGSLKTFFAFVKQGFLFCYDLGFVIMKLRGYNYTRLMITDVDSITKLLENETLVDNYFRAVLIVLAAVISFWFVALSWKQPRIWATFLPAMLVLVPGFCIGLVPSAVAFSMFLAAAFGFYVQTLGARHTERKTLKQWWHSLFHKQGRKQRFSFCARSGLYGWFTFLVSFAAMLVVALFTYQTPLLKLDDIRKSLDEGVNYVYNRVFYSRLETPQNAIGSMLEGNIHKTLHIPKFHNVPVLTVKSSTNEDIYLRAWITDDFTGEGWKVLDEQDDKELQKVVDASFDPSTLLFQLHEMLEPERLEATDTKQFGFVLDHLTLKAKFKKSLIVHMPNFPSTGKVIGKYSGLEIIAREMGFFTKSRPEKNVYEVNTIQPVVTTEGYVKALYGMQQTYQTLLRLDPEEIPSKTFNEFAQKEQAYSSYVKKHYMDASHITDTMATMAERVSEKYQSQLAKTMAIERHFRINYNYSVTPKMLGTKNAMMELDYCLKETMTGYCTYYATAMTMMLRHLGIPARYVTGYVVPKNYDADFSDSYSRTVIDTQAHAWVEVYFDGIGWMTFDPTPNNDELLSDLNARYYALDEADKQAAGMNTEEMISLHRISLREKEEEKEKEKEQEQEQEPENKIDFIKILLLIVCGLGILRAIITIIILFVVILKARVTKLCKRMQQGEPKQAIRQMHRMMLVVLANMHLSPELGELPEAYALRIDKAIRVAGGWQILLPIFTACEFGIRPPDEAQKTAVEIYFTGFCKFTLENRATRIPWWKRLWILWRCRKI